MLFEITSPPTICFIYHLVDPFTQKVFYVGRTNNCTGRYYAHIKSKQGTKDKYWKVQEILAMGSFPIMRVVLETTMKKSGAEELKEIRAQVKLGVKLLNRPSDLER